MAINQITIFDTTLRDGEQTPGVSLQTGEKLEIAQALAKLKVDIIEAGFPVASPGDFEAVSQIAKKVKGPVIAGLARTTPKDIETCAAAVKAAERPRIHTFIATSDLHLQYKLKMSRAEVLEQTSAAVALAKKLIGSVEFSAEDASRSDRDFLCQVLTKAIAAGAEVVNIPDTVGYSTPAEFGALIAYIVKNVPNIGSAAISVHCHNDLGLAVANSLAAVVNGARQIECTINGLGERAGNASLEELVMTLNTRRELYQATTAIDTKQIYRTSKIVSNLTGIAIPPTKAIVGENAFAHESGIHQHGVLENPLTYEIMRPEDVGINKNSIVLGKHSGRHAFEERLNLLGYELESEKINDLFLKFKKLADRKKTVFDQDIEALISEKAKATIQEWYNLDYYHVVSGNQTMATASVRLESATGIDEAAATGQGPVDAVFKAIEQAVGTPIDLTDYQLKAVTAGEDALGEATVTIASDEKKFIGRGLSVDVIEASAKAFLNATNKMLAVCGHPAKKKGS
ncbi:MAG: 2-isopropylmalate synthase [Sporomusaceae bacterium]|jgi:2-isopropylmalate synthase|nr:2-isopropylmalate synthase [Sporomusaceae bacterium]